MKRGEKVNFFRNKKGNSRFETVNTNRILPISKRSQIAVFVIIALMIVIILVLLFLRKPLSEFITGVSPVDQIRDCVRKYTEEAIGIISEQGGSLDPEFYYMYNGIKVEYLCYSEGYYERCIMQKPFIKQDMEKEIEKYIEPKVKGCMAGVKTDLEEEGYSVTLGNVNTNVELVPDNIIITVDSDFSFSKGGVETYKSIKTDISSRLYNLAMTTSAILNWEARYGDSETTPYMIYYPSMKVEKKKQGDGTTIYILSDRYTEDKFMFASRSAVIPSGITGN